MGERKFFFDIASIRSVAPGRLESILSNPLVAEEGGRLIFAYWVNMEIQEKKPLSPIQMGNFG